MTSWFRFSEKMHREDMKSLSYEWIWNVQQDKLSTDSFSTGILGCLPVLGKSSSP